jgi:hypothetical protein
VATQKIFIKMTLILVFIFVWGSFSFAEDKKDLPPASPGPQPQLASDQNKTADRDSSLTSTLSCPGKTTTTPESLMTPPVKIQEGTNPDD